MARNRKLRLGILFGGRSGEHEISLRSARCVFEAVDPQRYEVTLIGIDRSGRWHLLDSAAFRRLTAAAFPVLERGSVEVVLLSEGGHTELYDRHAPQTPLTRLDVIFPVLHGPFGEDGTVQGLLEMADVPYVGAGVLGSAVGMDKDVQKRLLHAAGLPIVPFHAVTRSQWAADAETVRRRARELGLPLFVKPANLGSSVGITKVKMPEALDAAIDEAFAYDLKIVIERGVDAREIECAVLGNDTPQVSVPGEICPQAEYYSYEAKYVDEHGAVFRIPAPLSESQTAAVQHLALRAFQVLECAGMARVDFFLERATDVWFVNELNTIPGFTTISQYPKLWEASGRPYAQLIDALIQLALDRHERRRALRQRYTPR